MKPAFIFILLISLLLGLTCNGWAQTDRLYPIYELTDEDLALIDIHDGSVADWLEVVGEPSITAREFVSYSPRQSMDPVQYDPTNLDFRIWLGWHGSTGHIYVAMERADDIYINEFDRTSSQFQERNPSYHDGSIEFFVDGDHSGGQHGMFDELVEEEERWLLENQQAQMYGAIAETYDQGSRVILYPQGFREDWFLQPPYAEGGGSAFGENPTISVTEFYVTPFDHLVWNRPEGSVISELYPGKVIGFFISVSDWDGAGFDQESYHFHKLVEILTYFKFSDDFAEGLLVGAGGFIPEDTAVENISWGRIKASFGE